MRVAVLQGVTTIATLSCAFDLRRGTRLPRAEGYCTIGSCGHGTKTAVSSLPKHLHGLLCDPLTCDLSLL